MENIELKLPDLNCGTCGFRTCEEFSLGVKKDPHLVERCIHLSESRTFVPERKNKESMRGGVKPTAALKDSLGRDYDFILEHFPEDPGPREIIIPHNPMITREMEIRKEDILIGRPLGMSCGCPVTHCGVVREVDPRTGVIVWCVTGPLNPRLKGYKDLGYYIAEGYEGLITDARSEIKIGVRYFFQPRMCMLQWRHSGLVNFLNRTEQGLQVRLEGLWIG
jgi:uncharacterized Fe-S cluster-containing protein